MKVLALCVLLAAGPMGGTAQAVQPSASVVTSQALTPLQVWSQNTANLLAARRTSVLNYIKNAWQKVVNAGAYRLRCGGSLASICPLCPRPTLVFGFGGPSNDPARMACAAACSRDLQECRSCHLAQINTCTTCVRTNTEALADGGCVKLACQTFYSEVCPVCPIPPASTCRLCPAGETSQECINCGRRNTECNACIRQNVQQFPIECRPLYISVQNTAARWATALLAPFVPVDTGVVYQTVSRTPTTGGTTVSGNAAAAGGNTASQGGLEGPVFVVGDDGQAYGVFTGDSTLGLSPADPASGAIGGASSGTGAGGSVAAQASAANVGAIRDDTLNHFETGEAFLDTDEAWTQSDFGSTWDAGNSSIGVNGSSVELLGLNPDGTLLISEAEVDAIFESAWLEESDLGENEVAEDVLGQESGGPLSLF